MAVKLISLSEHNAQIAASVPDPFLDAPRKNGVACPKCGAELFDTHPNLILSSMPPKKHVHCVKCPWRGERLA